jgi:hypothetical protein
MTLTAFAEKWGVDYSTAKRWRKDGLVVPSHGPVDVAKSEARLAERPSYNRGGKTKGPVAETEAPATGSLQEAKRTRMGFEALLAEHRRDKLCGSIVPVEAAVQAVAEDSTAIKTRFRQVPASVATKLAAATAAPAAGAIVYRAVCEALSDISGVPHGVGSLYLAPGEGKGIPANELTLYKVDCEGARHYIRKPREEQPIVEEPKKKRRRRSTAAIESAIAESGAEAEVDNDLIVAVERAIPAITLTEARTRREVAEGDLRRAQYQLVKHKVVHVDRVHAALTKNFNAVRSNVLAIASKVAPRAAMMTDAKEIQKVIASEVEMVLADMAGAKELVKGCLDD